MKFSITLVLMLLFAVAKAQTTYEISIDSNHTKSKIYKGLISKYILQNDTSFKWYNTNQKGYVPDSSVVDVFGKNKTGIRFLIFGGTWCEDTQLILPRFFKILETSGVPDQNVTLLGVNRKKESFGNLSATFAITNVPTIIVLRNGKETGRVVEYGKTGNWEKELSDIIQLP